MPNFKAGWGLPAIIESTSESAKMTVERFDNRLYFYADVDSDRCLALMRQVREMDAQLRAEQITRGLDSVTPIWLHIQSHGGDLFFAFSVADQIEAIRTPIYSIVEGCCASAATLISLACRKRYILPHGFMLIHQLTSALWGTHEQFKDDLRVQERLMEQLAAFYVAHSNLDAQTVRGMLMRDTWMDAEEVVRNGLADAIRLA